MKTIAQWSQNGSKITETSQRRRLMFVTARSVTRSQFLFESVHAATHDRALVANCRPTAKLNCPDVCVANTAQVMRTEKCHERKKTAYE